MKDSLNAELLTVFQDLSLLASFDWDQLLAEFHTEWSGLGHHEDAFESFALFLQDKAEKDESPDYLFEAAFFLLIQFKLKKAPPLTPHQERSHQLELNPSLHFLSLDYNIPDLFRKAGLEDFEFTPDKTLLAVYKNFDSTIIKQPLSRAELIILEKLESHSLSKNDLLKQLRSDDHLLLENLIQRNLIL